MKSLLINVLLWIIIAVPSVLYFKYYHTFYIDWYEIIELVSEKVACITWPHNDLTPPYFSVESETAYLVVGENWRQTYYLKNANCAISTTRVGWSWNLNKWFWNHDDWLGISSDIFSCDYIANTYWWCSVFQE